MSAIPLRAISGIGRTLSSKLAPLDVSTCADVLRFSLPELAQHLGEEEAQFVRQLALGIDERPIVSGEVKPISISCNFWFLNVWFWFFKIKKLFFKIHFFQPNRLLEISIDLIKCTYFLPLSPKCWPSGCWVTVVLQLRSRCEPASRLRKKTKREKRLCVLQPQFRASFRCRLRSIPLVLAWHELFLTTLRKFCHQA